MFCLIPTGAGYFAWGCFRYFGRVAIRPRTSIPSATSQLKSGTSRSLILSYDQLRLKQARWAPRRRAIGKDAQTPALTSNCASDRLRRLSVDADECPSHVFRITEALAVSVLLHDLGLARGGAPISKAFRCVAFRRGRGCKARSGATARPQSPT